MSDRARDPLSKKTIEKLLTKQGKPKARAQGAENVMTPWDMLILERLERDVVTAQAKAKEAGLRKSVLKAEHERLAQAIEVDLARSQADMAAAKAGHAKFLKELENRYNVSWQTHGYNPETGVINSVE